MEIKTSSPKELDSAQHKHETSQQLMPSPDLELAALRLFKRSLQKQKLMK